MQVSDLTVEVRDASLTRVGQLLPQDLVGFRAVLRFNNVGNWSIPLPADNPMADALRAPGAGLIVTGPQGVILSGPTTAAKRTQSQDDPIGTWEISGLDDSVVLAERLAYPTPTTADVTAQTSAYDVRTGAASSVMRAYIDANIGPSAPAARKISALTLAADTAIGSTVTGSARFDRLGELLSGLAVIDGLGFDIKQTGTSLEFRVYQPTDRSAAVRMDIDNNGLTKTEYTYTAPALTRAIVAGQGEGASRALVEVTTSDSTAAEAAWARRIELFKDQRGSATNDELTQAGNEALAEKGKTVEAISATPNDDQTMAYGVDWNLGDRVSVVVGSTTISRVVTEVGLLISPDGVRIGATVGEPSTADPESEAADSRANQEERIGNLERNEPAGGGGGGSSLIVSDTPPSSPSAGTQWFNSADGQTYIYFSNAWVELDSTGTNETQTGNVVINGAFEINQRNFSSTTTSGTFGFDRWLMLSTTGTVTYTAQTFGVSEAVPPGAPVSVSYARLTSSGQSGATPRAILSTRIEDVRTLAGQTVTLSFWAKAASGTPSVAFELIQDYGTGNANNTNGIGATKFAITSAWQRYTKTFTIPSTVGKTVAVGNYLAINLWTSAGSDFNSRTDSLGVQNTTIDFWGVQLEAGPAATPFRRNAPSIQAELAACQRYYWRNTAGAALATFGQGLTYAASAANIYIQNPVTMRATPTLLETQSLIVLDSSFSGAGSQSFGIIAAESTNQVVTVNMNGATGLTSNRPAILRANNNASAFIGLGAEL